MWTHKMGEKGSNPEPGAADSSGPMTFLRRLFTFWFPARTASRSTSISASVASPRGRIAAEFREWATGLALRVRENSGTGLRVVGRLGGREVVVDPGIDGAHPGWVQLTIGVALPALKPMLVTRATCPGDFAIARIRALFDDPDLGPELRAISVGPHHIRLRLAPGASPRIVEHAVRAVGETMRIIHAAPESEPRHSCATTVPYPG
jgi:hypothetical protein